MHVHTHQYLPCSNPISAGTIVILFLNNCNSLSFSRLENISGAIEGILFDPEEEVV